MPGSGASLGSSLKLGLDELRMLMLGTQVAFGFQFQSLFQERLDISEHVIRAAVLLGMGCIVLTLGMLIAAPAVHRVADAGDATERTQRLTSQLAHLALITLACGLAAAVFVTVTTEFGSRAGLIAAIAAAVVCVAAWHTWGSLLRSKAHRSKEAHSMKQRHASLHDRIDYVLTEARVILPGAQALLGFQLIVPLMKAFETLPSFARAVHFAALVFVAVAIVLLIAPAAIHRIAFAGDDDERFLSLSSNILTAALVPFALGIASELYVATVRLLPESSASQWTAGVAICVLLALWYALPLALRSHRESSRCSPQA